MHHHAGGLAGAGVSEHETLAELVPLLADLAGPTIVVGSVAPAPLLAAVGGEAAVIERFADLTATLRAVGDRPVVIVSYLAMWRPDGSVGHLAGVRRFLQDGSRLLFVEPTLGLGVAAGLQRFGRIVTRKRLGLSFHRDVPQDLRRAGYEVTSVVRFSIGYPQRFMTFAAGEARVHHRR